MRCYIQVNWACCLIHSKYSTNDSYYCSARECLCTCLIKDMHAENSIVCSEKYGGICSIFFNLKYEAGVGKLQFGGRIWPHLFV